MRRHERRGRIDAHVHLWDPADPGQGWLAGRPRIARAFRPGELETAAAAAGIGQVVLVQTIHDPAETRRFLQLAAERPLVAGVVGWVDLARPDVAELLAALREAPGGERLVGVRHLVQDEPRPGFLDRPQVRRGLRAVAAAGLAYDLLVHPPQLQEGARMARSLGELTVVLDHAGKPDVAGRSLDPWRSDLAELARLENVRCKLSGLVTEAGEGWRREQLTPFAEHLLSCFGPQRVLFGSDWPVCTEHATYGEVAELAEALLSGLAPSERDLVLGESARRAYRLAPPDLLCHPPGS